MDKETRPYIAWDVVQDFMVKAFTELGVPEADAEICAEVLMESDRRGIESHGVNRFKPIYVDRINKGILNPVTEVDIIRESPTTAVLDANDGMGRSTELPALPFVTHRTTVSRDTGLLWRLMKA